MFEEGRPENRRAKSDAESVLQPVPNNKFLWMRPSLARYNMISDSARTKKFWKKKIARPVLLSQTKPLTVSKAINNRVLQNGYFQNRVTVDTIFSGKKKASLKYTVKLNPPYRLGEINFPTSNDALSLEIKNLESGSLLKTGEIYSLGTIKAERTRIDRGLKEKGYVNFNSEFIILKADSVTSDKVIDVTLELKNDTPPESRIAYSIDSVLVVDDYSIENYNPDTLDFGYFKQITNSGSLRFDAIKKGIFFDHGDLYSRNNFGQTVRYLSDLPIIRYANIKLSQGSMDSTLNATIILSQRKRFAYSAEFNAIFRSTNYFGPGVILSYSDRNLKRGSELLKVNLRGRFEVQISEGIVNPAYELGIEVNYEVPRLYPRFLSNLLRQKLPKTHVSGGYNLFNRLDLYLLNSFYIDYGYKWSANDRIKHKFNPIELIYTFVPENSKSDEFRDYLQDNPGLARSFENQFVAGAGYDFTFNPPSGRHSDFYFNGGLDASGNLLAGIFSLTGAQKDSLGRYTLFGLPFSQYTRIRTDFRYGFNFNEKTSIVTRFVAGLGIPYGNSTVLPYVKQFYVGGTNSLRSFLARSIGPGAEVPPEGFNDLTADIRLETNLEFRFTVSGNFKAALFLDAGNIWLYNEDASRPDGNISKDFLKEVAISTGWGLRWDFSFVIARLDFGYTLRLPYLPEGERWVAKDINFFSPVWNIAIGYPF